MYCHLIGHEKAFRTKRFSLSADFVTARVSFPSTMRTDHLIWIFVESLGGIRGSQDPTRNGPEFSEDTPQHHVAGDLHTIKRLDYVGWLQHVSSRSGS